MSIKKLKKMLQEVVCDYQFICAGSNSYFCDEKIGITINIQKSSHSNMCYINYGFWVRELHNDEKNLSIEKCDVMGRFSITRDNKIRYDFPLEILDIEDVKDELRRNINEIIIPVIRDGIDMYFRLNPQAINTAKLNLRKYLEQI